MTVGQHNINVLVYAKNIKESKMLDNSLLRPKPNAQKILDKAKWLFLGKKIRRNKRINKAF